MNSKPVTLVATFQARSGKEAELRSLLTGLVAPTRKEPGCISYDLHVAEDAPGRFLFYENWTSHAAIDAHGETPHIKNLLSRVDELCSEFKLSYWEKIS
jgi:quinol monooxygenase YgiN